MSASRRTLRFSLLLALASCSSKEPGVNEPVAMQGGSSAGGTNGVAGSLMLDVPGAGGDPGSVPLPSGGDAAYALPEGYTAANSGGWLLGDPVEGGAEPTVPVGSGSVDGCGTEIVGIVRDFRRGDQPDGHPDFETYKGKGEKGIVDPLLDSNLKPVLAAGDHKFITSPADFEQWYHDVPNVNAPFFIYFSLAPTDGVLTFFSEAFFPLDGVGWGDQDQKHNFGFTTEVHTEFRYLGAETFTFTGDDDLVGVHQWPPGHRSRRLALTPNADDRARRRGPQPGNRVR